MFLQKRNVVPFFLNPDSCGIRGIPGIPAGMHNLGSRHPLVCWMVGLGLGQCNGSKTCFILSLTLLTGKLKSVKHDASHSREANNQRDQNNSLP
jgi:hypothetical protein